MRKLFILLFIVLSSCSNNTILKDHFLLEVGNSISINYDNKLTLNEISDEINIIPVETNDSALFENLFIAGLTENMIISYDKKALYSIDKSNGRVKTVLKKQGQGPQEYTTIFDVVLEADTIIYVYDAGKRGFLKFNFLGEFINFTKKDSISSFRRMADGNFYVCTSPFYNNGYFTQVYDSHWNLLRNGIINDRKNIKLFMHYLNGLKFYNKKLLFRDFFGDTIYQASLEEDKPYIVLSKGKYKMPVEIASERSKMDEESHKYINHLDYIVVNNYCFLTYYFDNKVYFDIWSLATSNLIYRNIAGSENDFYGIPIKVNDIMLSLWVDYAKDNYIYCVVQPEDAIKIDPLLPTDTNPIIIEIKLKDN